MTDGMVAETIAITGHGVTRSRPTSLARSTATDQPSVVVLHHMPGYDRASKEIVRTFAVYGYATLMPNLHHRYAPGAKAGDAAAAARDAGGVPDEQCLGDVQGAIDFLRRRPESNGKVGVIGYCSGGRQTFLVACTLDVDAAVDCYGGRATSISPQACAARCSDSSAPTTRARHPTTSPRMAKALEANGKTFDFHSYDGAGHAFFSVDRPSYRLDAAKDGWKQIWAFFGTHLKGA